MRLGLRGSRWRRAPANRSKDVGPRCRSLHAAMRRRSKHVPRRRLLQNRKRSRGLPENGTRRWNNRWRHQKCNASSARRLATWAVRICGAKFGNIYRWDGKALHILASHNTPAAFAEAVRRSPYRPYSPTSPIGSPSANIKNARTQSLFWKLKLGTP
jgi:hypothetical protein